MRPFDVNFNYTNFVTNGISLMNKHRLFKLHLL